MPDAQREYINTILTMYESGQDNAFECYLAIYKKNYDENDLQFIERCATLDYDDGFYNGAIYQEVFDRLNQK